MARRKRLLRHGIRAAQPFMRTPTNGRMGEKFRNGARPFKPAPKRLGKDRPDSKLRYSAASELAEAGCTDQQISAITGLKSLSMVRKYSKGASQKRLAKEAQSLRERNVKG
jgi:hypothetical protein